MRLLRWVAPDVVLKSATATISGTGTLTATGVRVVSTTATLTGTGTLTAIGTRVAAPTSRFGGGPISIRETDQQVSDERLARLIREDEEILCLI